MLSVYDMCSQRRLPPMDFARIVKPVYKRARHHERPPAANLVLPAIRADASRIDGDEADSKGRAFDASLQTGRDSRHQPYHIPDMATGAHQQQQQDRRRASENDLPPLRVLIDRLEDDEHRRARAHSQFKFQVPLTDNLLAPPTAPGGRSRSPTPSRHRGGASTVAPRLVPRPMATLSGPVKLQPLSG